MSYILEALRKSEQERNPNEMPNLKTHHPMIHKESKSKAVYWIFGIALLFIIGFLLTYILIGYLDGFGSQKTDDPVTITKPNTENSESAKSEQADNANIVSSQAQVQDNAVEESPITTVPVKEMVVTEQKAIAEPEPKITQLDRASIPDIFDLDYTFQQKIPDMEFSTHIFVSGGGSFVIINGKSLSDGTAIERGLVVVKILSDGVILSYKGRRFFLGSMTNWLRD